MNTRPETVTERRAKKLKEVNCNRVNIGVEHGNSNFRAFFSGFKKDQRAGIVKLARSMGMRGDHLWVP